MLDIETLSTAHDAVIVSIGAVRFNLSTGIYGDVFYRKIEKQSCTNVGLKIDPDTVDWWMSQEGYAKSEFLSKSDRISINDALIELSDFIMEDDFVWGNGVNFDCAILRNAFKVCEIPLPWSCFNERDVRTLVHFIPELKENEVFEGVPHHPVSDCLHQIKYCCKIYKKLKITEYEN